MARPYLRWRIRRGLEGIFLAHPERLDQACGAGPLLIAATHRAWWDGPVALQLSWDHALRPKLLVRPATLERFPWTRSLGAIPLPSGPGLLRALAPLRQGLQRPGDVAWIFPEGAQRPPGAPLVLMPGALTLARRLQVPVLPIALDYAFRESPRPAALLAVGPLLPPGSRDEALHRALQAGLAEIQAALLGQPTGFDLPNHEAEAPWLERWLRLGKGLK